MKLHRWNQIALEQLNPAFARQAIHTGRMTIAFLHLTKGGVVPEHHHENEQVCMVISGKLKFIAGGKEQTINPGEVLEIPSNLPHSVEVLEDSVVYDLFAPIRTDWLSGDDAYLRQTPTPPADKA
ncbi:MAG: cupin domain-containing protein [Acidobacteria bacterium]|nr:cupin domain-containing protein [Acidobacteriota bacterium]